MAQTQTVRFTANIPQSSFSGPTGVVGIEVKVLRNGQGNLVATLAVKTSKMG